MEVINRNLFTNQRSTTLVKESRKRRTVLAYFEVFHEYFKTGTARKETRKQTEGNELDNCGIGKRDRPRKVKSN